MSRAQDKTEGDSERMGAVTSTKAEHSLEPMVDSVVVFQHRLHLNHPQEHLVLFVGAIIHIEHDE